VIILKDTGHWLVEERPKEAMDALIPFLKEEGSKGRFVIPGSCGEAKSAAARFHVAGSSIRRSGASHINATNM